MDPDPSDHTVRCHRGCFGKYFELQTYHQDQCAAVIRLPGENIQQQMEMNVLPFKYVSAGNGETPELSVVMGADEKIVTGKIERLSEAVLDVELALSLVLKGSVYVSGIDKAECMQNGIIENIDETAMCILGNGVTGHHH